MLKKRVITALIATALLFVSVWFNDPLPWFTVLAVVWGALATLEFYRLVGVARSGLLTGFGLLGSLLLILSPHFMSEIPLYVLLSVLIVASLACLMFAPQKEEAFTGWVWAISGMLYVGLLLSYLVALQLEAGRNWLFLVLLPVFASDTAAFFIGRLLGKHRMAPLISPNKTWEGAVAGAVAAVIVAVLLTLPSPVQVPLGYVTAGILGLLISFFGQIGDLAESLLKRNMKVKESGVLLPGHGGLLDRMDSVVFAGVLVYLYFALVVS